MPIPGPARIEPLPDDQLPEWVTENKDIPRVNVVKTLARHESLIKPWNRFAANVIGDRSTLSGREREIAILRTGWNHQSDYEFGQHRIIGMRQGLSEQEVEDIARGPDHGNWPERERLIMVAADELFKNSEISDETWADLTEFYDDKQMIDIIFAVGQYTLVCFALKSIRVQLDEGVGGLPEV